MTAPFFRTDPSPAPDSLIAGEYPRAVQTATLAQSATPYRRGMVLGVVTATGKYVLSTAAATDGSQVPDAICHDDVSATAGDVTAAVLLTGEINPTAVILGAGHTLASIRQGLRNKGLFFKTTVAA